jgi:hypothetical protein
MLFLLNLSNNPDNLHLLVNVADNLFFLYQSICQQEIC